MEVRGPSPFSDLVACISLTFKHWLLAVPIVVASLLALVPFIIFGGATVLKAAVFGGDLQYEDIPTAFGPTLLVGAGLSAVVGIVLCIIAVAATYAGADDALQGRPVDLLSIAHRGAARFGPIFANGLLIGVVAVVVEVIVGGLVALTGGVLAVLFIPLLAFVGLLAAYHLMYVMPAIVLGDFGPGESIGESFELSQRDGRASATVFIGLIVAAVCAWLPGFFLHSIPLAGLVAGFVAGALNQTFQAVALTKFYLRLDGRVLSARPTASP
jgi:hypothetical protein